MSDQTPFPGPDPQTEQPAAPPPRRACPRCRGTFEGSPDSCPHCGLTKAEAAALSQQATITAPLAPPAPAQSTPETPVQETPVAEAPGPEDAGAEVDDSGRKSRVWLLAVPLVLLLLIGGYWYMSKGDKETNQPVEDACSSFREELLEVQSKEYPNSREQRRAVGGVLREARDAGCDADDLGSST